MFLHMFFWSDQVSNTQDGRRKSTWQYFANVFLVLFVDALLKALRSGVLLEVHCERAHGIHR